MLVVLFFLLCFILFILFALCQMKTKEERLTDDIEQELFLKLYQEKRKK